MAYYSVLLPIALIIALSKILMKVCARVKLPHVVGMLLTGLLLSLINYIPGQTIFSDVALEGLGFIAKIGVILIMFSAGLETDLKQLRAVGLPSVLITLAGVVLPLGLGFVVAVLFHGGFAGLTTDTALTCLFYGVILTATSVSVTVAVLRELGQLKSKIGSTIVSAAILDDIIGVIVLSFVVSMKGTDGTVSSPIRVILSTLLFFACVGIIGLISYRLFRWIEAKYPHHRMLPVFGLSLCFFFAYASEKWFGVADITGAFAAGLILSKNPESGYIDQKSDVMGYMIFTPVFFANIALNTSFTTINTDMVLFGLCFILAGMAGKVIGCGGTALLCKYSPVDSLRVGLGMMARAEVALVCAQKGVEVGIIDASIMPFILILIIATSFITPIFIRATYRTKENPKTV